MPVSISGGTESADRVDARNQRKGDPAGGQRLVVQPGGFHQRGNTRTVGVADVFQSAPDKDAVLAAQFYDIADGAQTEQIGVIVKQGVDVAILALQRHDQLEGDAYAGEVLEAARTVAAVQVHHRHRFGQVADRGVVIGDDRVDAEGIGVSDLGVGGDAVVYGNDELYALFMQGIDRRDIHAVALALARRYVVADVGADGFQIGIQQRRGRHAVRVVIAVNADFFAFLDRPAHAFRRLFHIPDLQRIGDVGHVVEEVLHFLLRSDAADLKQGRDDRRQFVFILNFQSLRLVERRDVP